MKELSIEQKAQCYDETIERAKKVLLDCTSEERKVVEYISPELAESDDEMIRKELINTINLAYDCGISITVENRDKYIAWLEKLGDIDNKFLRMRETKPKDISEFLDRLTTVEQEFFWEHIAKIRELDKEEQSKQKPQGKSVLEAAKEEKVNNQNCIKPNDKVEPKFHEGDWIIGDKDNMVHQVKTAIKNVSNGKYAYDLIDGGYISTSHESDYHLWTIKDAKDGNVLCYKDEISLYKHDIKNCTKQETTFGGFVYHCCYDGKGFVMDSLYSLTEQDKMDIHPATKEQCDFLFLKMKEAGYEWDAEKKKLKKIEQKPAEWEPQTGDTFRKKGTTSPTYHLCDKLEDGITFDFVENREVGMSGGEITISTLKQDYELVERPKSIEDVVNEELNKALQAKDEQTSTEWNDEDEKTLNAIALFLSSIDYLEDPETWINWLKSLKDRITLLPIEEVLTKVGLKPYKDGDQWCILLGDNIQEGICGFGNTVEDALYAFLKDLITSQSEQKPTTWSEEDEKILNLIIARLHSHPNVEAEEYGKDYHWFKSIKERYAWKPSEAQMVVLNDIIINGHLSNANERILKGLQEQLKKLMGNSYESKH